MISQDELYTIVNLVDLHSRTSDQELGMKLKVLINNIMDNVKIKNEEKHELEN